jgi:ABC-2 type transport system permease protein
MNPVIAKLTLRVLLGNRRGILLVALPLLLLIVATLLRSFLGADRELAVTVLGTQVMTLMLPLVALVTGTGAIGPEIDDGSIIYLMTKPVNRFTIAATKWAVAVGVTVIVGALPAFAAGCILTGSVTGLESGFALAATAGAVVYCSLFLALAVVNRHAVLIGLLYTIIWESLVGGLITGAQTLSVGQWAMSLAVRVSGQDGAALGVTSAVDLPVGVVGMSVLTVAGVWFVGWRLQHLQVTDSA